MRSKRLAAVAFVLLAIAYPAIVYSGLKRYSPKAIALTIGAILLVRFMWRQSGESRKRLSMMLVPPLILCVISFIANNREFILCLPVFTSVALLCSFGLTLFRGPSAVETFARMRVPDLTVDEMAHCRRMTWLWVGFFLVNGLIAFWTVRWGTLEAWGFYNGLVSYLIMGVLFAGEFIYRHWRFRRYIGLPTDPLLRRLFPPKV